ncbi:hypothetical protein DFH08DRAFT_815006 [Mycena albidolilacea]|uniref:Uncharacterized protein n=1 Tax=Mycena albidolilacea TaxID=1033008 RepID=A0AAD7EKW2_9AGAR|nr:hypothetical protein DFH08DRAFT_815006 [Mycena albidolilacea]
MVTVPVQDVWTDGQPSLGRAVPEHAIPSPDGSEDGHSVYRKMEDGQRILLVSFVVINLPVTRGWMKWQTRLVVGNRTDPPDVVLSLLAAAALHHITTITQEGKGGYYRLGKL